MLSTALGAADAGRAVTVVPDACAGVSAEHHDAALGPLELLAPQVRVETAAFLAG